MGLIAGWPRLSRFGLSGVAYHRRFVTEELLASVPLVLRTLVGGVAQTLL